MKNKLPSIVSKVAPDVRRFFDRVREILEAPNGFVTEKDLIDTGAFRRGPTGVGSLGDGSLGDGSLDFVDRTPEVISCSTPPSPTSLTASGAFTNIMLEWDASGYTGYGTETNICFAYTEVWRADSDDQGLALLLGTTQAEMYSDPVGEGATKYYWVRFVNNDGDVGDYNALNGVKGETAPDIPYLLGELAGKITSSELHADLGASINTNFGELPNAPATKPGGVALVAGDTYLDTSEDPDAWKRYNGVTWVTIVDGAIAAAQTAADDAQAVADGEIVGFFQGGEPSANVSSFGDIWIDTDKTAPVDSTCIYRYENSSGGSTGTVADPLSWVAAATNALGLLYLESYVAADSKNKVFTSTPFTPYKVGDLWAAGSAGDIKRCITAKASGAYTASHWVVASKYTDDTTADSKNKVFTSTPFTPYKVGDLWAAGSGGDVKRCITAKALGGYTAAHWTVASKYTDDTVADSKIKTYYQGASRHSNGTFINPPTGAVGYLWVITNENDDVYRHNGTTWVALKIASQSYVGTQITEKVGYCLFTPTNTAIVPNIATAYTTKTTCEGASSSAGAYSWKGNAALASKVDTVSTSVGLNTANITTAQDSVDGVKANYSVKIDTGGHISGFGLLSDASTATPTSDFGIRADTFWIAPPTVVSYYAPTTSNYKGKAWKHSFTGVVKYFTGTYNYVTDNNWSTTPQNLPFTVKSSPTYESNSGSNVLIPAGVYMDTAFIKDASITMAKIKDLTVDSAHITDGAITTAKIGNASITSAQITGLDVSKLTSTGAKITSAFINTADIANLVVTNLASLNHAEIAGGILTSVEWPILNNTPVPLVDPVDGPYVKITNLRIDAAKVDGNLSSSTAVADGGWELNDTGVSYFGGVLDAALIKTNSRMSDDVHGYSMPLRTLVTGEMATSSWGRSWQWDLIPGSGGMPNTSQYNDPAGWAYNPVFTNPATGYPPGWFRPANAFTTVVETAAYDEKTISGLPSSKWVGTSTWVPESNRVRSKNVTISVRFLLTSATAAAMSPLSWASYWAGADVHPMVQFVGVTPAGALEPIVGGLWETYKLQWMDFPSELQYKVGGSTELGGGWVPPGGTLPGNIVFQFGLTNRAPYDSTIEFSEITDPTYNNPNGLYFNRAWSKAPKQLGASGVPGYVMEIESYNI